MNDEQNIRANDLDSLIGDNHLQMMKAALPYMNVSQQRFISFFVKINELQRTISLFEEGEVAAMGICSAGERNHSESPIDLLNTIKPFASPSEQDLIDLIMNFFQGFRIAGSGSDTVPSSTVPNSTVPGSFVPLHAQSGGQTPPPPTPTAAPQHRSNNLFGRMPIEQLKNFMPPEQQTRFDTMQLMLSAMQQMN